MNLKALHLENQILRTGKLVIAYSGGVDSAFLLHAAHKLLKSDCLGVIADSPSLARSELKDALALADSIGAPVEILKTREFENPDYLANPLNRCYFCKHELFTALDELAQNRGFPAIAYGENADDMQQIRPGRKAAEEFSVLAPLRDAGLTKAEIRTLSREAGLPTSEKAASPCLSSRIPHGLPVTLEALARVEKGEEALRQLGFGIFRLRDHGSLARLEFAEQEFSRFDDPSLRQEIEKRLKEIGYTQVERNPNAYGSKVS